MSTVFVLLCNQQRRTLIIVIISQITPYFLCCTYIVTGDLPCVCVDLSSMIITSSILLFNMLGLFGNVNILIATYRNRNLQTKHGTLLAMLSFYHIMCLLFELFNVSFAIIGAPIYRNTCFMFMLPYLVFSCLQSMMFFVMSLDLFLAVSLPLKHLSTSMRQYVTLVSIPAIVYAVFIPSLAVYQAVFVEVGNNPIVLRCNPPLSMPVPVTQFWCRFNGYCNLATLGLYLFLIFFIYLKEKQRRTMVVETSGKTSETKKVIRSLTVLIICFALTWCCCMLSVDIAVILQLNREQTEFVQSYAVIFALLAYSMNYYVYFARNPVYRKAFLEQLGCRKEKGLATHQSGPMSTQMLDVRNLPTIRLERHSSRPPPPKFSSSQIQI